MRATHPINLGRTALLAALASISVATGAAPAVQADERGAAQALERAKSDPGMLRQFLWAMPKGADLHMHLSGAVYAESMVEFGARDGDCIDSSLTASSGPCVVGQRPLADALGDNVFQSQVMRAWSMKGFVPGEESGHDHFFATFDKFGDALDGHEGEGLASVARRARRQGVQYLEVLQTPRFGDVWALASRVGYTPDLDLLGERLLASGLRNILPRARADLDAQLAQERRADPSPTPLVRFDVQVLRAMPPAVVYTQMLLGFELMREDPRWVGINLVQPEDDIVALRDYRLHMRMLRHLRHRYRTGHITLHAGELTPGLAPPKDLRFHIRAAVETAGAERIGHGVDILSERNPVGLAREMARRDVLVEVPLTSNRQILGVSGRRHPLRFYRSHGVPIALATDDEGVSRTDLTEQYEQAARTHGLGYRALKRIATDSLRHAFLPAATRNRLLRRQANAFRHLEARYPRPSKRSKNQAAQKPLSR